MREFLSPRMLLLAGLALLFAAPASAAKGRRANPADKHNLAVQHAAATVSLVALQAALEEMSSLHCLLPKSKDSLAALQAGVASAQGYFTKTYGTYVAGVTKPMDGNGKCDGGFEAVAKESEIRRQMTSEFEYVIHDMQKKLSQGIIDGLLDADIEMPDNSEKQDCADKGEELHDAALDAGVAANQAITNFRTGVLKTEERFLSYTRQNAGLGTDCGSLTAGMATLVEAAAGTPIQVPQGKSVKPESTITGEIGKEKLAEIELMRGIKAQKLGGEAEEQAQSNVTGTNGGPAAAGTAAETGKKPLLDFGNPFTLSTTPVQSEEGGVRDLLAGKGGNDANTGSSLTGMIAEVQKSDLEKKAAVEAQKAAEIAGSMEASRSPASESASASTASTASTAFIASSAGSSQSVSSTQSAPAQLGSPDESLFRRMSMALRQGKRELEKRGR